jgi:hypothetical protein
MGERKTARPHVEATTHEQLKRDGAASPEVSPRERTASLQQRTLRTPRTQKKPARDARRRRSARCSLLRFCAAFLASARVAAIRSAPAPPQSPSARKHTQHPEGQFGAPATRCACLRLGKYHFVSTSLLSLSPPAGPVCAHARAVGAGAPALHPSHLWQHARACHAGRSRPVTRPRLPPQRRTRLSLVSLSLASRQRLSGSLWLWLRPRQSSHVRHVVLPSVRVEYPRHRLLPLPDLQGLGVDVRLPLLRVELRRVAKLFELHEEVA